MYQPRQNFTQNQQPPMSQSQQNLAQNQKIPIQPKTKNKFRWSIFAGIPLTIAIFICIAKNIEPSFHFDNILDYLDVIQRTKYARLACMAVLCLALIIIVKLVRNNQD